MTFFTAYRASDVNVPTFFIESTAPDNVDDTDQISTGSWPHLQLIVDSDEAVKEIAKILADGTNPNLVVMVHGFNNPRRDVLKTYTAAAIAIKEDAAIDKRQGLVCLGYRWPSEKMGSPLWATWTALPMLPTRIFYWATALAVLPFAAFFAPENCFEWLTDILRYARNLAADHLATLLGLALGGLVLTAALLRGIVYFRDNYRASNYGVPDLIQIIRAIDSEVHKLRPQWGGSHHPHPVQLSFIGHSMGGFVVTNTIRTLSDVFAASVQLNEFGAAGGTPGSDGQKIGHVFQLKRFLLASPDIPAEALLSNRGNFLASALSRFEEAYLFSSEGDEVLRQISTLANYFVFPTKSSNYGFRLGNVEILSNEFGLIKRAPDEIIDTLRVGNLTLRKLYEELDNAEVKRQPAGHQRAQAEITLPQVFSYFDCTDYKDVDNAGEERPLLTFAKCFKRHGGAAKMSFRSHMRLLFAYVLCGQKPNVHGGYFEGQLSQELIYRLACLGFEETVKTYSKRHDAHDRDALGSACGSKQIRVLLSPALDGPKVGPAAARIRNKRSATLEISGR